MRVLMLLCVWCTYCYQGIDGSTSGQGETELGNPKLVDGFSCCVDDWESMLCTWELGQNLITNDSITVRLKWAIMDGLSYCRHQTKTSCLWKYNDDRETFRTGLIYYMEVVVTTVGKADEAVLEIQSFNISTNMLVKPARVDSLTVVARNRTCMSLRWEHNKSYRNMLYTLHVKQGSHQQIYNYTNTTSATTCGLHPGLLYTLEVACVPIPYSYREPHGFYMFMPGLWKMVMPSGVPGVEISSFRYDRCSSQTSDCEVTIYWQPVPEMECNGEITQYQVTQIDTESGQMQEFEVEGSDTSLDLGVKKVRQYLIKLKARTRVGYSEHFTSLVIPAYQDKLPPPTNILVEAEGSVLHVSWGPPELSQSSPEGRILGYTLYYCTGSKFTYKCVDPVQWLHLPNNQTSFQWTLPDCDIDNMMFGISVEMETSRRNVSSGLLWNKCVYRQKDLLPPRNVRFSRKQPDNGLQVNWDKFVCADDPVYVSYFVLSYCVTNSHAECADPPLQVNVSNKDVSHMIQGLSAGVTFRVTLRAVSRTGEGPESDPITKEVTKALGYMWVVVVVVLLVLVLMMLVVCVCYWKVRKVTKKGFYLPVRMPEFPPSQITVSIGQHECNPNAVVEDNNNSTKRDVLSHMEHQDQSYTSGSRAKSYMKLHREEGSSSDASETLSSTGNKSVETYSTVDLPRVCTNADNMSACLSNQDCLISGQNYSPEMEVQLGFMFASSPFSFHVLNTQSPTLPTLSPTLHPQSPKPHNQPPTPYIQSPTPPTQSPTSPIQSPTPKTQSPSYPGLSPTPHSQPPTPPTHSPTTNIQSATPHTLSPTPKAQPLTPHLPSPTPNVQPPTPYPQSPTPHTALSTPNTQSPTPITQSPTPHPQSPTPPALSPTPHSQPPAPYIQPPTPHPQSPTPHTPSPTPKVQPPTPHTPSSTPITQSTTLHAQSPTPKTQPPTPHPQSPTPHTPSPTLNTQLPTPHTQSHTHNYFTTDPLSLAHLPTGPSTQPQTPPTVTRAYLSTPFVPPSHSQAPHNVITNQLSSPFPPFTSPTQSQATTAIATCLPPSCPPATPLPSCTPTQAPCAGYVSHEEALNLCQTKNHHE